MGSATHCRTIRQTCSCIDSETPVARVFLPAPDDDEGELMEMGRAGYLPAPQPHHGHPEALALYRGFVAAWIPTPGVVRNLTVLRGSRPAPRCQSAISSDAHVPDWLVSAK